MNIMARAPPRNDPFTRTAGLCAVRRRLERMCIRPATMPASHFLGRNSEAREEGVHEANMHGFANA
jgi:hypothetical protein